MTHLQYPRIRPHVARETSRDRPGCYQLVDRLGLAPPVRVTAEEFSWLDQFDGTRGLADMLPNSGGRRMPLDRLAALARRLEDNLLLEGPRFRQVVDSAV